MNPSYWLIASGIFSSLSVAVIKLTGGIYPLSVLLMAKFIVVFAGTFLILCVNGISVKTKFFGVHFARFLCGGTAALIAVFLSLNLPVVMTQICFFSTPLAVLLLLNLIAHYYHFEHTSYKLIGLALIGFIANICMLAPSMDCFEEIGWISFPLCLLYNILSAVSLLSLRWLGINNEPPTRTTFYFAGLTVITCFFVTLLLNHTFQFQLSDSRWMFLPVIGLLTLGIQLIRSYSWGKGASSLNVIFTYISFPVSFLLGLCLFDEKFSWNEAVGLALIVLTAYLSVKEVNQKTKSLLTSLKQRSQTNQSIP